MKKLYITTAIYYAKGNPYIAHMIEKILAGIVARVVRVQGHNVQSMTVIDEHGQKCQPINKKIGFLKKNNAIKSQITSNVPAMYSAFLIIVIKEQQTRTKLKLYKNV